MKLSKRISACLPLILLLSSYAQTSPRSGQNATSGTPEERLRAAAQAFSLETLRASPWHLTIDMRIRREPKADEEHGTVDMWQSGEDSRVDYKFGDSTETLLVTEGKTFKAQTGKAIFESARAVLQAVLHPGPEEEDFKDTKPELRHETMLHQQFDCIMLTTSVNQLEVRPLGLFPTYCLLDGTNSLGITYNFGSQTVLIRSAGTFLARRVPLLVELGEGSSVSALGKVTKLATFMPDADTFAVGSLRLTEGQTVAVSGGVMATALVNKVQPVYPERARQDRVHGIVQLHVRIGRDGRVHSIRVISTPSSDLAISAIAAVRQWTYKPYILDGASQEVDTTIIVNYNMSTF